MTDVHVVEDIPQVFSSTGEYVAPDLDVVAALTPERRKRLGALARCAANATAADAELKTATAVQADAVAANIAAQTTLEKVRPRLTATQAAFDWIKQQHANARR